STYAATRLYRGPVTFCLAASGHVAGVVNPPAAAKYGYWTNAATPPDADAWPDGAQAHDGSWWPEWGRWVGRFAGGKVAPRIPGAGALSPIRDAPGRYVVERAD